MSETASHERYFCNRVMRSLQRIGEAMFALHGRGVGRMFAQFGREIQRDIYDMLNEGYLDPDMVPVSRSGLVLLPGFAAKNARRQRAAWDYFVFLYMSHKAQNITRRAIASGELSSPTIVYLRGADYQFAVARDGAGIGQTTTQDFNFSLAMVDRFGERFNVVKALSPADLHWAMVLIGAFLAARGNSLGSVAEFARLHQGGLFLNPGNWRDRVLELFPSASLFMVYVSNQSNGLSYEMEALVACGLEAHILVLDDDRFGSRNSFFEAQKRLATAKENVYLRVDRDACAVDDPEAFERLVARFPHKLVLGEDKSAFLGQVEALIPAVIRHGTAAPADFPFEFRVPLEAADQAEAEALRRHVAEVLDRVFAQVTVVNWPVVLVYVEMDIFLNLAFGDILKAAVSSARYGAMADFMREYLREVAPERAASLDELLQQCGDVGMSVAYVGYSLGEWNDHDDRRALARERMDAIAGDTIDLMRRSVGSADDIIIRKAKEDLPPPEETQHSALLESLLKANGMLKDT